MVCGECGAKNDDVELYCKKCGADLQIHFSGATPVLASGVEAGGGEIQKREEEEPSASVVATLAEVEVQEEKTKKSAQPVSSPYSPSEVEAGVAETTQEAKEAKPDAQPKEPAWERFLQEEEKEKLAGEYVLSEDEGILGSPRPEKAKEEEEEEKGPKPVRFDFEEEG